MKIILKILRVYFNTMARINFKMSGKHAFHLFGFPFKAKLKDAHQKFLDSADKFTLIVDGQKIQGYKWGSGSESILLVHGWQSNSYRWKVMINSFDLTKYSLYAFDAPGHGNSEGRICTVPLYEKTMETLIEQCRDINHFIGHSIGSFSCASFLFHKKYKARTYISLASPLGASEFIADFQERLELTPLAYKSVLNYFENYIGSPIGYYTHEIFCKAINPDATLIIHDENDHATSFQNSVRMKELLQLNNQKVELILTQGLSHNLRGKEVVERVVQFISEHTLATEDLVGNKVIR